MKRLALASAVAAALSTSVVVADSFKTEPGIVVGGSGGFIKPDNERNLDTGGFYDVYGGYRFDSGLELALGYLYGEMGAESAGQPPAEIDPGYELDLRYYLSDNRTQPYIGAGLSDFRYDYDYGPNSGGDTILGVIVGVKHFLTDSLFVNAEIKQLLDDEEADTLVGLGAGYMFGQSSSPTVAAPAPAPAPAPKPAPVAFIDSDKDGVEDALDACPATPMGVAVDANGCAKDDDKDGVPNYKDECLTSPAGARVDDEGCEIEYVAEKTSLAINVTFATNSDALTAGSTTEIKKAADFLATYENATMVVEGHTDNTGSAAYNKTLSQKRADAVRKVLIEQFNVDPARVSAVGYGEERPIADNNTAAGRQANRRVVGEVEGQKSVRVKR